MVGIDPPRPLGHCRMSRRGDCWDNAVAESFFATVKVERVRGADWITRAHGRSEVFGPRSSQFSRRFEHGVGLLYAGGSWDRVVRFRRNDSIEREWAQYLDVVSFEPRSQSYQTTVVLRKR